MTRTTEDIEDMIDTYADMILRLAINQTKNHATAEDITQTVCMKYMESDMKFENAEHKKAWLLRVTINECKKHFRSFFTAKRVVLPEGCELSAEAATEDSLECEAVTEAIGALPLKYRSVIHLYYYENYSVKEISRLLGKKENTVMSDLHRARAALKSKLQYS